MLISLIYFLKISINISKKITYMTQSNCSSREAYKSSLLLAIDFQAVSTAVSERWCGRALLAIDFQAVSTAVSEGWCSRALRPPNEPPLHLGWAGTQVISFKALAMVQQKAIIYVYIRITWMNSVYLLYDSMIRSNDCTSLPKVSLQMKCVEYFKTRMTDCLQGYKKKISWIPCVG